MSYWLRTSVIIAYIIFVLNVNITCGYYLSALLPELHSVLFGDGLHHHGHYHDYYHHHHGYDHYNHYNGLYDFYDSDWYNDGHFYGGGYHNVWPKVDRPPQPPPPPAAAAAQPQSPAPSLTGSLRTLIGLGALAGMSGALSIRPLVLVNFGAHKKFWKKKLIKKLL
ncbi:hypothetical protein O3M35_002923 [Rhynocoris fuscipes]|uniref:Uncharacterized protein n=1 Tax=Rhynocoris fuscipes TaxID=488301 RepID=A0AAW1CUU9_9HEMI